MIMTQVLSSLLRGDLAALEDLPPNVRNDALLDLAKLAGEGKLSGKYLFKHDQILTIFVSFQRKCKRKSLLNWHRI